MHRHEAALSSEEYSEKAIENPDPEHKWDLESASLEPDGTLNVWNAAGQTVEITPKNRDAVVSLLLQGRLHNVHMNALIEATADGPVAPTTKQALKDLFDEIMRFAPPATAAVLRSTVPSAALLWTVTPELRITSCTGNAKQYLREQDRELLKGSPDLWTLLGTSDATHPMVAAHLQALAGEPSKITHSRGAEWSMYLQPVRDDSGAVVGAVGYATVTNMLPPAAPVPMAETAFMLTDHEGVVIAQNGDISHLLGINTPREYVVGKEVAHIVHEHVLGVVDQPKQFVKRLAAVMSSEGEETDRVVLKDGRVIHRHMQPLKDPTGNILARAWVLTEAVVKRAGKAVAAGMLFLMLGFGAVNNYDFDGDGVADIPAPKRLLTL